MIGAAIICVRAPAAWSTSSSRCSSPSCSRRRRRRVRPSRSTPSTSVMSRTPTASRQRCAIAWMGVSTRSARATWSARTARRSTVVDHLGLPIEGQMARAGTVYTVFNADLSRYSKHRPSILNWIVTPDASFGEIGMGLLRAVRPVDAVDRRVGLRHQQGRAGPVSGGDRSEDQGADRRSVGRHRHRQNVDLVRQPGLRDPVFEGPGALRRRRSPSASAVERAWATTPACRTATISVGNWPTPSRGGPARSFWKAIRKSGRRSGSRSCCAPTSRGSTTLR